MTRKFENRTITISRFKSRTNAFNFANSGKALAVMLGDDEMFWVCRLSDCEWLGRNGYEWAR